MKGLPASVRLMVNGDVKMSCTGSKMVETEVVVHETVWDILESWGASWMWEYVNEEDRNRDLSWVREGMLAGTLVWCCDGSYKKKVAPTASGAGWVVYCKKKLATCWRVTSLKYQRMRDRTEGSNWGCVQCII